MNNVQSRTSLIGLLIFILLDKIIPKKILKNIKVLSLIYFFIICLGLIVPTLYVFIYNNKLSFNLIYFNKPMYTGREVICNNLYHLIKNDLSLLFRLGTNFNLVKNHSLNIHNSFLGFISNYGTLGFLSYFFILYCSLKQRLKQKFLSNSNITIIISLLYNDYRIF